MSISLLHSFVSAKQQSANSSLVSKNAWNAEHLLTQASAGILGASSAGTTDIITPADISDFITFLQRGTAAQSRTLESKLQEEFDAGDFGTIVTDDSGSDVRDENTATINRAILAVSTDIGGGTVRLPTGDIYVSQTASSPSDLAILMKPNVWLRGRSGTVLKTTTPEFNVVVAFGEFEFALSDFSIDTDDYEGAELRPAIYAQGSTGFFIKRTNILQMGLMGILIQGCADGLISRCKIEKTTPRNYQNQAIEVSQALENTNITIEHNKISGSAIEIAANGLFVRNNRIDNWKFGGGITTGTTDWVTNAVITGNVVSRSSGVDTNVVYPDGIENWASNAVIANNICYECSNSGIYSGGSNAAITGNVCYDNGQTLVGAHGIFLQYVTPGDPNFTADGTIVSGNRCFNLNGTTQDYGFGTNLSLTNITLGTNDFRGNAIAEYGPVATGIRYAPYYASGLLELNETNGIIATRGRATTDSVALHARSSDYSSTFTATALYQGGTAAGSTVAGFANGGLGALIFQNTTNGLIHINNDVPLNISINGSTRTILTSSLYTVNVALRYGGVTLTNAVAGTGKMVLDTSPTIATPTVSGALTYGGVTLTANVTGTGKMVLDTSPTIATPVINSAAHVGGAWVADATWTLPAHTLGGTVSGGGNQINNSIIGTSTPLAGFFTALTANSITFNSTTGVVGTATNNDAAAGSVGEYVTANLARGSATSLSDGTDKTVISVSLTAGDWDVSALGEFVPAAGTNVYRLRASLSATNNTADTTAGRIVSMAYHGTAIDATYSPSIAIPTARFSLSGTTTVYLVVAGGFNNDTLAGYGFISARRVR